MKSRILAAIAVCGLLFSTGCMGTMVKGMKKVHYKMTGVKNAAIQVPGLPDQSIRINNRYNSRVYVFRDSYSGSIEHTEIFDNGGFIGVVGSEGYLCWERRPGHMLLTGTMEGLNTPFVKKAELTLEAGKVYYIRLDMAWGGSLKVVDEERGKKLLEKCDPPELSNPL